MRGSSSLLGILRIRHIGSQGLVASVLLVLALLVAPAAGAQTFEEASAAYDRGDYAVAFESLRTLAEQGDARAQILIGKMYHEGRGVPWDEVEAVRWYRRAAEQGHADAQFMLGMRYVGGLGVPQDYSEMLFWYYRAAQHRAM